MKTQQEVKKEIENLLPELDFEYYGDGNGERELCMEAFGKVDAYLDVLGLEVDHFGTHEDIVERIKKAIAPFLIVIAMLFSSCSKDEGGQCYDFTVKHIITSTPAQSGYPINEVITETKCGLEDDAEALQHSRSIEERSNNKVVNGYSIVEGFTVTKITLKK